MNTDTASLRQEIVRLHTALRSCVQELCVVRSMTYLLNPSLQFRLSTMAACSQDLTAAEVCQRPSSGMCETFIQDMRYALHMTCTL
jgi:hypothetical protein